MKTLLLRMVAAAALACIAATPVLAQKKKDSDDRPTRSVQGAVTDKADSPVDGAIVQLKDTKTLQIRSFITKKNGTYHFHSLSPDIDYELKAQSKGASSDSKTLSSFDSRKSAVINLKIDN